MEDKIVINDVTYIKEKEDYSLEDLKQLMINEAYVQLRDRYLNMELIELINLILKD